MRDSDHLAMNSKCIIICRSIHNDNTMKLAKAMAKTPGCFFLSTNDAQRAVTLHYKWIDAINDAKRHSIRISLY